MPSVYVAHHIIVPTVRHDVDRLNDVGVFQRRAHAELGSHFFLVGFRRLALSLWTKLLYGECPSIALYESHRPTCATP